MCRCEWAPVAAGDGTGLYLHIPAYACVFMFVWIWVLMYHASPPVTHGFAATTLARVAECPCRLAERGDPLCGSPRRRGASCTSFVTPFGPLCLWLPRSGPTWQLTVQTDICSFQPPGEQRKQQPTDPALLLSALHIAYSFTASVRAATIFWCSNRKSHIYLSIHLTIYLSIYLYIYISPLI